MTIWIILAIVFALVLVIGIVCLIKEKGDSDIVRVLIALALILFIVFVSVSIYQVVSLNKEQIRQTKEREQIIYQIEHLTEDSDKIKLNEWILTYNDWVNEVNSEKECYGWFAWHHNFDMSKHTIINLA